MNKPKPQEEFPKGIDTELIEYGLSMTPMERVEENELLLQFAMEVWEQNGIKSLAYDKEPT